MSDQHLIGTELDDVLIGAEGNDLLEGMGGADMMFGGLGNDVYIPGPLSTPYGAPDYIFDDGGDDELRLEGVAPGEVQRFRFGDDLSFWVNGQGTILNIGGWFADPSHQIEHIVFDDGTVWAPEESSALRVFGTPGDDFLFGSIYDDRIEGRGGNDLMFGNAGNDVYVPGPGFGSDFVFDIGGLDELRLEGISPDELSRTRTSSGSDLHLSRAGSFESLTLSNWFEGSAYQIERIVFDDGTVWTPEETGVLRYVGTDEHDHIIGTDWSERFEAHGGGDMLIGEGGDDVYVVEAGGIDWIVESSGNDEVQLTGISPDQVERVRDPGSDNLTLRMPGMFNTLTFENWFQGPGNQVERVVFDDGTVWTAAETQSLRLLGTEGSDYIVGSEYSERIEGRGGNDILDGRGGDDVLVGGEGMDWMQGGTGNDVYLLGNVPGPDVVADVADESGGNQVVLSSYLSSEIQLSYQSVFLGLFTTWGEALVRINAFDPNDVLGGVRGVQDFTFLDGTLSYEQLVARGFDIHATGNISEDYVQGTNLQDRIYGSWQAETLVGLQGDDSLYGAGGNDTLWGMEGNDYLDGGADNDSLFGGVGSDTYYFDRLSGNDRFLELVELADDHGDVDTIVFGPDIAPEDLVASLDSLGRLLITINGSSASLLFNEWFNTEISTRIEYFTFQNGTIVLTGEDITALLNDAPVLANPIADQAARDAVAFNFTVPQNTFFDDDAGDTLSYAAGLAGGGALPSWLAFNAVTHAFSGTPTSANVGDAFNVEVVATDSLGASVSDVFTITVGTAPNLNLVGTAGADTLIGASGNDRLDGLAGNDRLDGGAGADNMIGGAGDDVYVADNTGDRATEAAGGGTDTVESYISLSLSTSAWANVENLTLAGNAAINGTGNSSANILTGNSAANVLIGGIGNDTYYVGAGDSVVENSGAGVDLVVSDVSWTLAANVENLTLVGSAAIDGTGNGFDNVFTGNSAANVLTGGIGNDTYYVGAGDTVVENSAAGVDTVISDVSVVLWHFVEHLTLTGTADLNGTGTTWHNQITGNAGNNVLTGALGNDTLNGGDGNDTLYGGDDEDTLNGGNGNDVLDGGTGADEMAGGAGDDVYYVDNIDDLVGEAANAGTDLVIASINHTLGSSVENLILTGSANLTGQGNSSANAIAGNSGNNTLIGAGGNDNITATAGNDRIEGDTGNDTLTGGAGADSFVFDSVAGASNADVITDFEAVDRLLLDNAVMAALGANGNFSNNDARFWASAAGTAHDSSDRVLYNTNTGELWYDPDGILSMSRQLIATLQDDPTLLASQISII
jgi:Ca2+-binding RTX toxin-like protein